MISANRSDAMPRCESVSDPGTRRRILVVDDSRFQRRVLASGLKRRGYEVFEADSGREALSFLAEQRVDMILSDWLMPGMTGLDLCQAIRARPDDGYIYVILLTSKTEKEEIAQGLNAGADDFLTKPVNGPELEARIRAGERLLDLERRLIEQNNAVSEALSELQGVYGALDRDLRDAKTLQRSLLRATDASFGPARLCLLLESSGHVGGDLTGFFRINERFLGLYGLDVSGHGVGSAMMTARLAGLLTGSTPGQNLALGFAPDGSPVPRDPADVAADLNTLLLTEMETQHYFTMVLCYLDLTTGDMTGVQAGHPHPLLQNPAGEIRALGEGGLPVGLIPGARWDTFSERLAVGDRFVLLSDGVIEAWAPNGQMLDASGAADLLARERASATNTVLAGIVKNLRAYTGTASFEDDVSGLVLDFGS